MAAIQWYPGHMTKARRELAARMPSQDVIVEVLDARMPAASANPVITELRGATRCLKILTRSDLADPAVTSAWLRHLEAAPGATVRAFAATRWAWAAPPRAWSHCSTAAKGISPRMVAAAEFASSAPRSRSPAPPRCLRCSRPRCCPAGRPPTPHNSQTAPTNPRR